MKSNINHRTSTKSINSIDKCTDTNKKKKIFFFIHQLNSGGAQRVILNIVKHLDKSKFEVKLVVVNNIGEFSGFNHPDVSIIDFKSKSIKSSILKIFRLIIKEKPDIVFSGLSVLSLTIATLIPLIKLKNSTKFIARESSIPSRSIPMQKKPWIINALYKLFYNRFDQIICQSEYMKNDLINNFNQKEKKIIVINNPIDIDNVLSLSNETFSGLANNKTNLLAVGRLHKVKGFDLSIRALQILDQSYHLSIIGDGNEKENLHNLAKELKVENRVHFLGYQPNPYKYMKNGNIFVLSSRHEGFPNVVLEANICGLPVVAFRSPGGTEEIIENGFNGYLVDPENVELLAKTINKSSNTTWNKYSIFKNINRKYESALIIRKYEKVFSGL